MLTLVDQLRLGFESEPSPEPSQCEIPHYEIAWISVIKYGARRDS